MKYTFYPILENLKNYPTEFYLMNHCIIYRLSTSKQYFAASPHFPCYSSIIFQLQRKLLQPNCQKTIKILPQGYVVSTALQGHHLMEVFHCRQ